MQLFGHEPVTVATRILLDGYAAESLQAKRYDFHMGRKLEAHLRNARFAIAERLVLGDRELAFDGPAEAALLEAWCARFTRMALLQRFCGAQFEDVRHDFLSCLARAQHVTRAQVVFCLGRKA